LPPARRGSPARLEALTEEDLAAVIPTPAFGDTPRGIFLATVLFHQACHAGQLAMARRLAGHPGATRIPMTEQGRSVT